MVNEKRQVVRYAFYKLDPAWRRLTAERQASAKLEFGETLERYHGRLLLRPYGLVGIRGDCDFLLWQVAEDLDALVELQTALNRTDLGAYLSIPYSYLAMALRRSGASSCPLRATPTLTCVQMSLWDRLDTLGGAGAAQAVSRRPTRADGFTPVATLSELPPGTAKRVYAANDAVALFNVSGTVYAIANRCTHARASLSEGTVDPARCTVTCPWQEGVFSLETGRVLGGPPVHPVSTYQVKLEGDTILIAQEAREPTVVPAPPAIS